MQQPRLIYGLMSRDRAKALLTDRPPGTFALRFSSSNPGHLAVSYVDGKRIVQHTLIKVSIFLHVNIVRKNVVND